MNKNYNVRFLGRYESKKVEIGLATELVEVVDVEDRNSLVNQPQDLVNVEEHHIQSVLNGKGV